MTKKSLLWAIPLAIAVLIATAILALPSYVASGYHRGTIEQLASTLTGRDVHIAGKLSLALFPEPQLIAGDITINGPDHEIITARSLTLDIAPGALLHGQLSARSITLQSPLIALPWPLPGGAASIAPPPWLTALHGQIEDGQISLGALTFTHVSADIFTGGNSALSISGTGNLVGTLINLSLSLGQLSAVGTSPVSLDLQATGATGLKAHISGTFDAASTLDGTASITAANLASLNPTLTQPLTANADLTAGASQIALANLHISQGSAKLAGLATLALQHPALTLELTGNKLNLAASTLLNSIAGNYGALPTHMTLNATATVISGVTVPQLQTTADFNRSGITLQAFNASLPGGSTLSLIGTLDPTGAVTGKALFQAPGLGRFLAALGSTASIPPNWQQASLSARLSGTPTHLNLDHLTGSLGPSGITGTAVIANQRIISGHLHFDQLDLTPIIEALRNGAATTAFTTDLEVTADRATLYKIPLSHLLLDAELGNQINVRRLSATVYGGLADSSFTITQDGQITSARAILAIPSAAPIAALLPASLQPPATFSKAPLAISILAAGPANALATSATMTLGDISITAAPTLNLTQQTATGPFTLRHPDGIAAMKAFRLTSGLAWPGAGSISLRANLALSPTQISLTDFVLSMGDLTANGKLALTSDHQINGEIAADTLALPPIPSDITLPWKQLANAQGKISITANQVWLAGTPILGPSTASIVLNPNKFALTLNHAALGTGTLAGNLTATTAPTTPPALAANLQLSSLDASTLCLPLHFPFTLSTGTLNASATLTASGYTPPTWLSTLAGTAALTAQSGTITGFNLPGLAAALTAPGKRATKLRAATLTGTTPFDSLTLNGNFQTGIYQLTNATLQSPTGTATATGNIDLPDTGVTLALTLTPSVPAPPKTLVTIAGNWTTPRKIPALKPALTWQPPPNTK
jgi:uncharacterized protein involved in outer membrane biogenesis